MNKNTVRQQLNIHMKEGKINFYQMMCIIREIPQYKLMSELSNQEKNLIEQYIKNKNGK